MDKKTKIHIDIDTTNNERFIDIEHVKRTVWQSLAYLKTARNQIGWSIAELSRRSGVSVGVISDLENNKMKVPSLVNFIALARALGMSKEFIIDMVFECEPCDSSNKKDRISSISEGLKDYGIHDQESMDFIMNTIEFVKGRTKNKKIN